METTLEQNVWRLTKRLIALGEGYIPPYEFNSGIDSAPYLQQLGFEVLGTDEDNRFYRVKPPVGHSINTQNNVRTLADQLDKITDETGREVLVQYIDNTIQVDLGRTTGSIANMAITSWSGKPI